MRVADRPECRKAKCSVNTFESGERVLVDEGDLIALQLQRVQLVQVSEYAGRHLRQLIVRQNQRVQVLQACVHAEKTMMVLLSCEAGAPKMRTLEIAFLNRANLVLLDLQLAQHVEDAERLLRHRCQLISAQI